MRGKILFVVGLGVGYVLGTRAGRERYEQIRRAAQGVWNQPVVQQGVETVKDFAAARVGDAGDVLLDKAKDLIGQATKRSGATKRDVSKAADQARSSVSKTADAVKSAVDSAAGALEDAVDEAEDAAGKAAKPNPRSTTKRTSSSRSTGSRKPAASDS
ncbi:hypothetical protein [Agromyces sp. LHK192]|uniref:hypothetical protein n=1 Tax=Agromyces sp. LHK192 TaxID=2498704 RepID=UPI000FDCC6E2|nr:hypothetical protein [Agromyces sp. LHK192]